VGNVVAPEVELVAQPLLPQQPGEALRALERAGGVLPLALPAHDQHAQPAAQPVEVVAVQVLDVVGGVVEVDGVAALAPADRRDVVDPALADREREQVGALEREVGGVVGAEAGPGDGDLLRAADVVVDERHDRADDPRLVGAVAAGALLQGQRLVVPRLAVDRVDAVELHAARLDQAGDRLDHAHVLVVVGVAALRREREQRPSVVAVGEQSETLRVQRDVAALHAGRRR
jgi:hypothetical protein